MLSDAPGSGPDSELPDIDDRLVEPGTPYVMYEGELVRVSPADPPHAEMHIQLAALIEAHTGPAFEVGADLLTRTSKRDDIAPDVSVFPDAPHPETGRRQLEQLAFEIVSTESLAHASRKAAKLAGRGVRRVFAIDVERARVLEWSAALATWRMIDPAGCIDDPALEVPLPVDAMISAAKADDAVARALLARRNPVLEARLAERAEDGFARGRAQGIQEGVAHARSELLADAVLAVLAARTITLNDAQCARIREEANVEQLQRWLTTAATCAAAAELFPDRAGR